MCKLLTNVSKELTRLFYLLTITKIYLSEINYSLINFTIMKKLLLSLIVVACVFSTNAQSLSAPKMGIGFQYGFMSFGVSARMDFTENHSAQAIVGLLGPLKSYSGKYMYCFNESGYNFVIKPYLFAQAGMIKYSMFNINETIFAYGGGAGIEWHIPFITEHLRVNWELGYGKADLSNYNFNSIIFGAGLHYYFEF
jgi:hypothetical protein